MSKARLRNLARLGKLGPMVPPIRPEFLPGYSFAGFALNTNRKRSRAGLVSIHDVPHVAEAGAASVGEVLAGSLVGETSDISSEVHGDISPFSDTQCQSKNYQKVTNVAFTGVMADDALIRKRNLRALKLGPKELTQLIGGRYSYWHEMLHNDQKSFGEKIARKIEDRLSLPRLSLDNEGISASVTDDLQRRLLESAVSFRPSFSRPADALGADDAQLLAAVKTVLSIHEIHDIMRRYDLFLEAVAVEAKRQATAAAPPPPITPTGDVEHDGLADNIYDAAIRQGAQPQQTKIRLGPNLQEGLAASKKKGHG